MHTADRSSCPALSMGRTAEQLKQAVGESGILGTVERKGLNVKEWVPPRLRPFLGDDLAAVTEEGVLRLIGLAEGTDLDFKRDPYGGSEADKKEMALDVASFANAGGGLLAVGVDEDDATASALAPVEDTETDEGLRVRQVVASRIDPLPLLHVRRVVVDGGLVWLVSVSPSHRAPHAVTLGDSLRYVVRDGPRKRALSEAEVADRYARRFAGVAERRQSLAEMWSEAQARAQAKADPDSAWLVLALVPDIPGGLTMRRGLADEWQEWILPALVEFPGLHRGGLDVTTGFRGLDLHDDRYEGPPSIRDHGGRLMLDGGGYLIFRLPNGRVVLGGDAEDSVRIYDEHVWGDLVNGLGVLARHAIRAGTAGDAQVSAAVVCPGRMALAQYRAQFAGVLRDTFPIDNTTGVSRHTISLDACVAPGPELVGAARLLGSDLSSAFGVPEPQQADGLALILDRFHRDHSDRVKRWADEAGVELLEHLPE